MDIKTKISTLWIVVMFNMIYADILGFIHPGALAKIIAGDVGIDLNQGILLVFSVLLEIPIIMIFLSRILDQKINRIANIVAPVLTIIFVIGGGDTTLSYIFFAGTEVVCMIAIMVMAWKWKESMA